MMAQVQLGVYTAKERSIEIVERLEEIREEIPGRVLETLEGEGSRVYIQPPERSYLIIPVLQQCNTGLNGPRKKQGAALVSMPLSAWLREGEDPLCREIHVS